MTPVPPPSSHLHDDIAALRAIVRAAGYSGPAVRARLGTEEEVLSRTTDFPGHLKRLEGDEGPLATLIRLFVLLASASRESVDSVFAPLGAAGLEALGLVVPRAEGRVVAAVRLIPHDAFVIASDLSEAGAGPEHVPGVQRPSNTLANLTVRRPVGRALDLGTGNGIQALLASTHADHVVATDVNERALAFARFNLALNGAANVELRQGSFFEPVEGERFDLVVANPPYVISPESSLVFRDSGLGRDRVSETLVQALPHVLEEGGLATIMVSWIPDGDDATQRARGWLADSGCDAWILHTGTDDALSAAAGWNRTGGTLAERAERVDRWVAYFREEGIDAICYGAIVLRKRTSPSNWVEASELPLRGLSPASAALERMFAAQDFLESVPDDESLLAHRFRAGDGVTLEQRLGQEQGRWALQQSELRLGSGLNFTAGLDESATVVVSGLDPTRTLREQLEETAAVLEVPREEFVRAGAALVRRMLALGFAVPADSGDPLV